MRAAAGGGRDSGAPSPRDPQGAGPPANMWRDSWEGFVRGFGLAYACRAGLGLMLHALNLARQRQWSAMAGWSLLSEKSLSYRWVLMGTKTPRLTWEKSGGRWEMWPTFWTVSRCRTDESPFRWLLGAFCPRSRYCACGSHG